MARTLLSEMRRGIREIHGSDAFAPAMVLVGVALLSGNIAALCAGGSCALRRAPESRNLSIDLRPGSLRATSGVEVGLIQDAVIDGTDVSVTVVLPGSFGGGHGRWPAYRPQGMRCGGAA